ncbi:hypothetical protein BX659_1762 [Orenia metallireducens]|uniref:Uncharacterized protein n=1 Tax=Orenia metallireducens TaxID=1413210 RepID=A0A285IK57_9FIRM|nr:DUF6364 family protein [Orenia metallireducens]PRX16171.1 hypothetical protein BX659_1762 [Orenia metallireducens]SNY48293.1 hypothetical protein SAMN06265827_1752 [Orenia metallireducens]
MKDKLTLSIEKDVIEFAHQFAKETNQSISSILEKYLMELKEIQDKEYEVSSRVKKLSGFFEDKDFPENKEKMRRIFHEKINNGC